MGVVAHNPRVSGECGPQAPNDCARLVGPVVHDPRLLGLCAPDPRWPHRPTMPAATAHAVNVASIIGRRSELVGLLGDLDDTPVPSRVSDLSVAVYRAGWATERTRDRSRTASTASYA